jgi:hypothetical protein
VAYCSQSDLEIALGGAYKLVEVADPNGTGSADPATVEDYLESAAGQIRSVVEVQYEPETIASLDADSQRLLRDINKWLSARIACLEGMRGEAIPPHIEQQAEKVEQWLTEIRTRERKLGRVANGRAAVSTHAAGVVDHDPRGTGVSMTAFRTYGYR